MANTYEGKPCKHCGGTIRYKDGHCVHRWRNDHLSEEARLKRREIQRKHDYNYNNSYKGWWRNRKRALAEQKQRYTQELERVQKELYGN